MSRRRVIRAAGTVAQPLDDAIMTARRVATDCGLVVDPNSAHATTLTFHQATSRSSSTIMIEFSEIEPCSTRLAVTVAVPTLPGRQSHGRRLADQLLDGMAARRPLRLTY